MRKYFECRKCGEEVSKYAKVCPNCGELFEEIDYDKRIIGTVDAIKTSALLFVTIMILYIVISLIVLLSVVSGPIEGEFLIFILLFIGIAFTITYFSYYFIIWKANILEVLYKISKK